MITLRLVHSIPGSFDPVFGGAAAGVGVMQGALSTVAVLSGIAAGVGDVDGDITAFFPTLDFSDARNSQYFALTL